MKKIMFNDRYELTDAVLQGRKTVTRRMITGEMSQCWMQDCIDRNFTLEIEDNNLCAYTSDRELYYSFGAPYKVGEIVAVAQSYLIGLNPVNWIINGLNKNSAGWRNKMFVRADLMPHQIRITDIRAERLQDISEEDCLKEGIVSTHSWNSHDLNGDEIVRHLYGFSSMKNIGTPKQAFSSLIDKISGRGTWEKNPFVWRIEFELVM